MMDLASPVGAFVRQWCNIGTALSVSIGDLYEGWVLGCREQGTHKATDRGVFGRDLRAAFPAVTSYQPREGQERYRAYKGIELTLSAQATLSNARNARIAKEQREASHVI